MRWSVEQSKVDRNGLVIDPYAGSGTTGIACRKMGIRCILIESDAEYVSIIVKRLGDCEIPLLRGIV